MVARYATEHKQRTRRRIVDAAGRRLKSSGLSGSGVATLMADAGLTNGAFYAHFASKDELVARVVTDQLDRQRDAVAESGVEQMVRAYLSAEHRDHPAHGCPSAALLSELGRSGDGVPRAYTEGVLGVVDAVVVRLANRGLGREFVQQLLGRGVAKVYAAARNTTTITDDDPRVVPLRLDVTDPDSVARAADVAPDVDVVINNAGISTPTPVLSGDTTNLRRELEVNLFGPLSVTSAFAERLADRSGAVVDVASVLSWIGIGGSYSVSKAALWSATDSLRLELGPRGVQVVGVYMGYVDTDMTSGVEAPKSAPADVVRQVLEHGL